MKKLFYLCSFLGFLHLTHAQNTDWVKQSSSISDFTNHSIYSIEELDGNFFIAGDFRPDITFDDVNFAIESETADGFILQIDSDGEAISFWHFKSTGYLRINKISKNPISGSLIVTGYYNHDMTFDGNYWESDFISNGFIMSVQKDGTLNWMHEFKGQNEVSSGFGDGLAVDKDGNVYVGIEAFGEVNIVNQSFSFEQETSGAIIAKFDTDGNLQSAQEWKGTTFEGVIDITELIIDESNDLLIVGSASGGFTIQDINYSFSQTTSQAFIIKQETDLNLQWLKMYDCNRCHVLDILVDGNDLLVSFQYNDFFNIEGETLIGTGSWGEMAIVSLDVNANLNWVKNFTLTENGGTSGVYGKSLELWQDKYYIGGMYQGDVLHNGNVILNNEEKSSYQYPFLISLNKEGSLESFQDFAGSNGIGLVSDISSNEENLLFGGDFSQHLSFQDSIVSAVNSALFYIGISNNTSHTTDNNVEQNILVYPTQSNDIIYIQSRISYMKVSLISSEGKLISELDKYEKSINVASINSGLYYLVFETEIGTITKEFIKL